VLHGIVGKSEVSSELIAWPGDECMQEFMGQPCMELRPGCWPSREAYPGGRRGPAMQRCVACTPGEMGESSGGRCGLHSDALV
jgi:hypothetical protein